MDLEAVTLYAFLFFILITSGFVLTISINGLDMSGWNFAGSEFMKAVLPHFPLIYFTLASAIVVLFAWNKQK